VTSTGDVACWGYVLGAYQDATPFVGSALQNITSVGIAATFVCAHRSTDNARVCWGDNQYYDLGDGSQTSTAVPTAFDAGTFTFVASRTYTGSCGLTTSGGVSCWGNNTTLQGGGALGGYLLTPTPVSDSSGPLTGCTKLALTNDHSCAVCGGKAVCWGENAHAELGRGTITDATAVAAPVAIPSSRPIVALGTTQGGGYALTDDGHLYCWGAHERSECATAGSGLNVPTPVAAAQ
jgi:alpha-tubulin suppressor-like RCC1 family protein